MDRVLNSVHLVFTKPIKELVENVIRTAIPAMDQQPVTVPHVLTPMMLYSPLMEKLLAVIVGHHAVMDITLMDGSAESVTNHAPHAPKQTFATHANQTVSFSFWAPRNLASVSHHPSARVEVLPQKTNTGPATIRRC